MTLPSSVTSFSSNVFYSCKNLKFVDIPSSVNSIGTYTFAYCNSLLELVLRKTSGVCTLSNSNAFNDTPMRGFNNLTGTVYVPSALISAYQTATNWKTFFNNGTVIFEAIEGSKYEL